MNDRENQNVTTENAGNGKARLTHTMFYKACETLKKHKQKFMDERPNAHQAAKMLSELCGFPVSDNSVNEIKEAANVDWQPKRKNPANGTSSGWHARNAIEALTRAVHRLYKKLDEEVPAGVQTLYEQIQTGEKPKPE
jgi:hypothetical protein